MNTGCDLSLKLKVFRYPHTESELKEIDRIKSFFSNEGYSVLSRHLRLTPFFREEANELMLIIAMK